MDMGQLPTPNSHLPKRAATVLAFVIASVALTAQQTGLDPARILKPLADDWASYSGDYSGRRYSALRQVNQSNVKNLTLAWTVRLNAGPNGAGAGVTAPYTPRAARTIVGGVGTNDYVGGTSVKGSILAVDNVCTSRHRTTSGRSMRPTATCSGSTSGGRRAARTSATAAPRSGATTSSSSRPTAYFVSLDARTGEERWHKELASFNQQYFCTSAPTVVDNHVIIGTGNDLDSPGISRRSIHRTATVQWKFYSVPMNPGDAGLETWKDLDAARNGGGHPWIPGSYDPETRLYIFGTGNPTPAYTDTPRGTGDNLFTNCVVAVNVDTGRWRGTTRPIRMTPTTGIRRRRRSSLTACSTGSRASWSSPPRATAITSRSIASPASISSPASSPRP
jgi:alcohol dehydrogenase (cytochrome c)